MSSENSGTTRRHPACGQGQHFEHGIVLRHFELQDASSQLLSAADRITAGLPAAVAVGSLLAVGTSRGVVLVFDAQQTLRWCLGGAAGIGTEYGAVTSLRYIVFTVQHYMMCIHSVVCAVTWFLSVCLSHTSVLSKWLNGFCGFLHRGCPQLIPHCALKEITCS